MDEIKRNNGRDKERSPNRNRSRSSRSKSRSRSMRHHSRRTRSRTPERRRRTKQRTRSPSNNHRRKSRTRSRSSSRTRHHRSARKHSRSKSPHSSSRSKQEHKQDMAKVSKVALQNQKGYEDGSDHSADDSASSSNNSPYNNRKNDDEEPIDKERIHREMEQKLREALAREGKVYPPKKPEASHPVFANDGSFLEIFKKMQEQQTAGTTPLTAMTSGNATIIPPQLQNATPITAAYVAASASGRSAPPPPMVGRRRGGKILKTGMVAKQRVSADGANADPKDFWSLYLAEVNKYKNTACESETGNRPLVK